MSNQNEQTEQTDLTTPEAVAAGQEVYARLTPGQNVTAELDAAYGRDSK